MNRVLIAITGIAAALLATPGVAKVETATDGGFVVSYELDVAASPATLWATLVRPQDWWNGAHSWSGNAANFWMTPQPGGCFCETLPAGKTRNAAGFVEHQRVIYVDPGTMLRLSGALGPLQSEALTGTMSYSIAAATDGTSKLKVDYILGGYSRLPLKPVAPVVDKVIGEQLSRLKAAAEKGRR